MISRNPIRGRNCRNVPHHTPNGCRFFHRTAAAGVLPLSFLYPPFFYPYLPLFFLTLPLLSWQLPCGDALPDPPPALWMYSGNARKKHVWALFPPAGDRLLRCAVLSLSRRSPDGFLRHPIYGCLNPPCALQTPVPCFSGQRGFCLMMHCACLLYPVNSGASHCFEIPMPFAFPLFRIHYLRHLLFC